MLAAPPANASRRAALLLVELDTTLAERLGEHLRSEGFRVSLRPEPLALTACLELLRADPPDVLILSGRPGGLELCRGLRQAGCSLPVLVLSDGDAIAARVAGLDVGADDYILPPYDPGALIDRVQCQLRRLQLLDDGVLRLADLTMNTRTREVRRGNQAIELTAREYDLLQFLLEHAREPVSREQILQGVWGEDFDGESNVVEVYIRYLRMKIEREGEKKLIHTVRSVGYSLRD